MNFIRDNVVATILLSATAMVIVGGIILAHRQSDCPARLARYQKQGVELQQLGVSFSNAFGIMSREALEKQAGVLIDKTEDAMAEARDLRGWCLASAKADEIERSLQ